MEISQDLGHVNTVFLRFNPDSYLDRRGNKVPSCWSTAVPTKSSAESLLTTAVNDF